MHYWLATSSLKLWLRPRSMCVCIGIGARKARMPACGAHAS